MVRLGVAFDLFAYSTNVFQFQYGSIGRCISMIYAKDSFGFNSSMVRLGDWHPVNRNSEIRGFNSSMVRLGGKVHRPVDFALFVSIPVWFDWEQCVRK